MDDYDDATQQPWYSHGGDVKEIVIESGVTGIGYNAFLDCMDLTSVSIPASVTAVGSMAFRGCFNLSEVVLPAGVRVIGDNAFSDNAVSNVITNAHAAVRVANPVTRLRCSNILTHSPGGLEVSQ